MDANPRDGIELTPRTSRCLGDSLAKVWHKTAPAAVRRAYRDGDEGAGWSAWVRHLAERKRPLGLRQLLETGHSPIAWAVHDELVDGAAGRLLELDRLDANRSRRNAAESMLNAYLSGTANEPSAGDALESLAWCHALPRLAERIAPALWWALLDHLAGTATDAAGIDLSKAPLVHQLLAGELPLALAYLFPEITACRKLAKPARHALSAGLADLLDGEGLPHATNLGLLRPLLACWTRCRAIGNETSHGCWDRAAQEQYQWLVRQALRLTRSDGTQVFAAESGRHSRQLLAAALRLCAGGDVDRIADRVLPKTWKVNGAPHGKGPLPDAASHSEWAAVGVLRPGWKRSHPRLTVAYPGESVRIELQCGHDVVLSGAWQFEVRCRAAAIRPVSHWEEICWVSDADVDYLELEIPLSDGFRLQRHLLLAREDRFLFLADAILGPETADVEYRGRLPLAPGASFEPAHETREGFLRGGRPTALVMPLALPEWRLDPRTGSLVERDGHLELAQAMRGGAGFAPLFFDLQSRRMARPATWRQLTVAEDLKIVPPEVAVGYRVQAGGGQWLIYRSLGRPGNRTLLGHNLVTELLVARFRRDGEVEPLIEIESE